jgi:hypothetical protein
MSGDSSAVEAPVIPTRVEPPVAPQNAWLEERQHLERQLIERLKAAFPQVIPNHARPLDGTVVEKRATDPGKPLRDVTDYELAGARTFDIPRGPEFIGERIAYGQRIRQVWSWATRGRRFRYNEWWATYSHYGYQHQSKCVACGDDDIWTNCDQPAQQRCRKCRWTSGACSDNPKVACATAYTRHQCRCESCRKWNTDAVRQRRARKRAKAKETCTSVLSRSNKVISTPELTTPVVLRTKNAGTRPEPETWTWLPIEARDHIARHAVFVHAHYAGKEAARRKCFCRKCKKHGFLREELSENWLCVQCDPNRRGLATGCAEYMNDTRDQLNIVT